MVLERKYGQMEVSTRVNLSMEKPKEKVSLSILKMVSFILGIGKMIKQMERVLLHKLVVHLIMAIGKMMLKMDSDKKNGQITQNTLVSIKED